MIEMVRGTDGARMRGRCLLLLSVVATVLFVMVTGASDLAEAGTGTKAVWGFVYDSEGDPIPNILVTVNIKTSEGDPRSTLQDTTGPADLTPTGFYTVTFAPDEWYVGDIIEVVVSYSGDQEIVTKGITGEGAEEINVQFEYAIPQFGSWFGFAIAAALVAVVALVALRRKKKA